MAARFQQLKAAGDNMKHTRSLPTIAHRDDLVVIRGESMRASTAALNWSGSMAMPVSLKGSRAQSLDELGNLDDETQIIAPVVSNLIHTISRTSFEEHLDISRYLFYKKLIKDASLLARKGVFCEFIVWTKVSLSSRRTVCNIVFYLTAIYQVDIIGIPIIKIRR